MSIYPMYPWVRTYLRVLFAAYVTIVVVAACAMSYTDRWQQAMPFGVMLFAGVVGGASAIHYYTKGVPPPEGMTQPTERLPGDRGICFVTENDNGDQRNICFLPADMVGLLYPAAPLVGLVVSVAVWSLVYAAMT